MSIQPDEVHGVLRRLMLVDGMKAVPDLERSRGCTMVDARTGDEWIDFFSCFASLPLGWNHPALASDDFVRRARNATINKPSCSDLYTVEEAEFVEAFDRFAVPDSFQHLFLIEGGALAVENAMKVAFDWKWKRVRDRDDGDPAAGTGAEILHFERAFHGRSGYTLTVTNTFDPRKTALFPKFDWPRVPAAPAEFPLEGEALARTESRETASLDACRKALQERGDRVAAILVEPIQGEGGDNHFRAEWLRGLRNLADEFDVLLIFDEVQTGFGGTGRVWCWEHFDCPPDILAFGKKTQVCGILAGARVDEVEDNCFAVSSRINSTWGGNLVDMVRCTRVIEVLESDGLVESAGAAGDRLTAGLRDIAAEHPDLLSNVRGRGLWSAVTLPDTDHRDRFRTALSERRLLSLPSGPDSVRFRPSLALTDDVTDRALEVLADAAGALAGGAPA